MHACIANWVHDVCGCWYGSLATLFYRPLNKNQAYETWVHKIAISSNQFYIPDATKCSQCMRLLYIKPFFPFFARLLVSLIAIWYRATKKKSKIGNARAGNTKLYIANAQFVQCIPSLCSTYPIVQVHNVHAITNTNGVKEKKLFHFFA